MEAEEIPVFTASGSSVWRCNMRQEKHARLRLVKQVGPIFCNVLTTGKFAGRWLQMQPWKTRRIAAPQCLATPHEDHA
jgi:hypothetical protein